MNSLADWLGYINGLHHKTIDLGLTRIRAIAEELDLLRLDCPVITVAGTNGKGSCVAVLTSIYQQAGYRVAAYTSPHLLHFNERLQLNHQCLSDQAWVAAFQCIEHQRAERVLSFFEFTTLAALYLIKFQLKPDVAVLEIGLGGRLDAVNIIDNTIAVLTSVGLDHCEWLGDTREAIGAEKAAIVRRDSDLVCGDPDPPASVARVAAERGGRLQQIGRDFPLLASETGNCWHACGLHTHAVSSAVYVIEQLEALLPVSPTAQAAGLKSIILPGRFEIIQSPGKLVIIADVAHNAQATIQLAARIRQGYPGRRYLAVVGMLADKNISAALAPLVPMIEHWFCGDLSHEPRGAKSDQIAMALRAHDAKKIAAFGTVEAALAAAIGYHRGLGGSVEETVIVVFGSFHTVAAAKRECLMERVG